MTRECGLCGTFSPDVATLLVEWAEPQMGRRWDSIDRCRDSVACRLRVESAGRCWEVRDSAETVARYHEAGGGRRHVK